MWLEACTKQAVTRPILLSAMNSVSTFVPGIQVASMNAERLSKKVSQCIWTLKSNSSWVICELITVLVMFSLLWPAEKQDLLWLCLRQSSSRLGKMTEFTAVEHAAGVPYWSTREKWMPVFKWLCPFSLCISLSSPWDAATAFRAVSLLSYIALWTHLQTQTCALLMP